MSDDNSLLVDLSDGGNSFASAPASAFGSTAAPGAAPIAESPAMRAEQHRRTAYEANVKNLVRKISATQERLLALRFDYSLEEADIRIGVDNLCRELRRLQLEMHMLNDEENVAFEASLKLANLGLDARTLTRSESKADDKVGEKLEKNKIQDSLFDFPDADLKLMKTKSTESMKTKSPAEKWQSLVKMSVEWKHQDKVNQGAAALRAKNPSVEETNQLRVAILSLQRRHPLSAADSALLAQLQEKLRAATKKVRKVKHEVIVVPQKKF